MIIDLIILISSGELSVINESQKSNEDSSRTQEGEMLEGSHHVISLVGKSPINLKILSFSRLLKEGVSVEQDTCGKHVFSVKEGKHFIDRVHSIFSGTNNEEFTNLTKEA